MAGIGEIPASGWSLRESYARFDADRRFGVSHITAEEPAECIAGLVLQGQKKPHECAAFGVRCTPTGRWALRWCRPKGRVRRIIDTDGKQY